VLTISGGNHDRIFKIFGFDDTDGDAENVTISGLTLTDGVPFFPGCCTNPDGGAILSTDGAGTDDQEFDFGQPADLTLRDLVIRNSNAFFGGAIANEIGDSVSAGALTIRNTTIEGNDAFVGGGVWAANVNRPINVQASTFDDNAAQVPDEVTAPRAPGFFQDGDGGGMAVGDGTGAVVVENSTFTANSADNAGGGIRFIAFGGDPRTVRNSTIVGNDAREGGGISVARFSPPDDQGGAAPGGLVQDPLVNLSSDVIANNVASDVASDADGPDLRTDQASFNIGFSLVEVTTGAAHTQAPAGSNIVGQDPQLGALAANGGPTQTMLPAATSPAVDAGVANGLITEQRLTARTVDRPNANAAGGDATDMGAVELAGDEAPAHNQRCLGDIFFVKRGDDGDDVINGTPDRDGVFAKGGADDVFGLADDDCLFGGRGNDAVEGGPDDDYVNGDPDNDKVDGNAGSDDARGQNGNDKVNGGPGDDRRVSGGAGDDKVRGGPGDDRLIKGDGGNDVINPGDGQDYVHAGGGRDVIDAADGDRDKIVCGAGKDKAIVDVDDTVDPDCNNVQFA
jgi:hypothetical protein